MHAGDWSRVDPSWRRAYNVMIARMLALGIDCAGRPPVWAFEGPDTGKKLILETADMLLSIVQWRDGVVVLDLDVPDDQVLLSSYSRWCDFGFALMDGGPADMDWKVGKADRRNTIQVGVQACLPVLRREWVLGIRTLELPPARWREVEEQLRSNGLLT